jgi:predicted MFS family arabinose efflux permease
VVGGALVDAADWRLVFWINVPVGLVALTLTALFLPESRATEPQRADPLGQVLVFVLLAGLTYAIIEGPSSGWRSREIVACFVLSGLAAAGLLLLEPMLAEPLLDLRVFRSAPFSGATAVAVCSFAAMAGFLLLNTLYLQEVRGFSALKAGLYTLPIAAMSIVFSPLAGRLVAARGPRVPMFVAGLGLTLGCIPLYTLANDSATWRLFLGYVLFGIGYGMVNPPITSAAVAGLPRGQAGVAAGIASTSRQVGAVLGVAVIGSVVTSSMTGSLKNTFAQASHLGWFLISGLGLAVLVVGQVTSSGWARRTAPRFEEYADETGAHRWSADRELPSE